jgi:hypothetical protein
MLILVIVGAERDAQASRKAGLALPKKLFHVSQTLRWKWGVFALPVVEDFMMSHQRVRELAGRHGSAVGVLKIRSAAMEVTNPILPPYERCMDTALSTEFVDPPERFVDADNEGRLIPELRQAAAPRNPYKILARAAAAFFGAQHPTAGSVPADDEALGNALADLSVTGRMAYCLFKTPPLTPLDDLAVGSGVNHIDLGHPPLTQARLREVIGEELELLINATPAEMTMPRLIAWLRAHGLQKGEEGDDLLRQNRSFVFFEGRIDAGSAQPEGASGMALTPLRSIAVDKVIWAYGLPFFIDADLPWRDDSPKPFRRVVIPQDTGSAIVGPGRADIYFGLGDAAGARAGALRHHGQFYLLLPKE